MSKSHKRGHLSHIEGFDEDSLIRPGHAEITENEAIYVEMSPGQASLHHGYMLHASTDNQSNQVRIGLAINYLSPASRLVLADRNAAMLVRGEDRFGYYQEIPPPCGDMTAGGLLWHAKLMP
jgi:hypothetical protein